MDLSLPSSLKKFVQAKVQSGEFSSEAAVIEAALECFQELDSPTLGGLIDHEFVAFCDREGDLNVSLDDVLRVTSRIPGSLAQCLIEEERADRF